MPRGKGYGQRDALINSRKKGADAMELTLGGSKKAARPGFGPHGPGRQMKKSNSDRFVTDERSGGQMVDDHAAPNPSDGIPNWKGN